MIYGDISSCDLGNLYIYDDILLLCDAMLAYSGAYYIMRHAMCLIASVYVCTWRAHDSDSHRCMLLCSAASCYYIL